MTTSAPEATGEGVLFAVGPDIAKRLTVVTLHKTCLETVGLSFDKYMSEGG